MQKSFTTPAGQTVTVVEKPADTPQPAPAPAPTPTPAPAAVVVTQEKKAEAPSTTVVKVEKKTDTAPAPASTTSTTTTKSDGATATTTTTKSDAATVHEIPVTVKPAQPELRKVKTETQLGQTTTTVQSTSVLTKDVGIFKEQVAQTDRTLILIERLATVTKEDFKIIDESGKHVSDHIRLSLLDRPS